jgi:hypothetical protein
MTTETLTTATLADSLADLLCLETGIIWNCLTCPMQSLRIHDHILGARHDALGHALLFHTHQLDSVELSLQFTNAADRELREEHRRAAAMPGIERIWEEHIPLSLDEDRICDLIGCPPDAAHRERR